ncbi:MAG: acyl carrier protein [Bacillota bacterium]
MNVEVKVKKIVAEQLEVDADKLLLDTTFEDIDADSLDIVELVMALEEEFDLEISDQEIENIKTVGDVIKYIESKVK